MLVANETVAQHLDDHDVPTLYRIHEAPDPLKVEQFEEFISTLGYSLGAPPSDVQAARTSRSWSSRCTARRRRSRSPS